MKKYIGLLAVLGGFAVFSTAQAASPDGAGPWADSIVSSSQGMTKNGGAIPADRSAPTNALGVAESGGAAVDPTADPVTFFSLGFGGSVTLGFNNAIGNGPGNDLQVYEVTIGNYPDEKVKVEASEDGSSWTVLSASVNRDGGVDLGNLQCVKYIRLTDVSPASQFEDSADGYDLDGVKALNTSKKDCAPKCDPPSHGGGYDGDNNHKYDYEKQVLEKRLEERQGRINGTPTLNFSTVKSSGFGR
jgi:hypothetical protein